MAVLTPRGYQLELLEESLKHNIVVAIPTGSGKTFIAALRVQAELERSHQKKVVWFLCPKVALAEQQYKAIKDSISPAHRTIFLSGSDGVDHWTSQQIWDRVLTGVSVVVCTYQILYDALSSGYVRLAEISLLIFDEAHCCQKRHPANRIMQAYYHPARLQKKDVPFVMGLTASPIGSRVEDLMDIEANLNAIAKTANRTEAELLQNVHMPKLCNILFPATPIGHGMDLLDQLELLKLRLYTEVHNDPYVVFLKSQRSDDFNIQLNRQLENAVNRGKTWCQDQSKRLINVSRCIAENMGSYSFHVYLRHCLGKLGGAEAHLDIPDSLREKEVRHFCDAVDALSLGQNSVDINDIEAHAPKLNLLIDTIAKQVNPTDTGIIFVKERATVRLLADMLALHPRTRNIVRPGTFVGSSSYRDRPSHISELGDSRGQQNNLDDLRSGVKNLIIATNVLEEGIDVPDCNLVICYDRPANVRAFIQGRGRARKAQSQLIIFFPAGDESSMKQWQSLEDEMKAKYADDMRNLEQLQRLESEEEGYREYIVQSTGAKLLLDNAVDRLHKFCSSIPSNPSFFAQPVFNFWLDSDQSLQSCTVYLPNDIDASLRRHESASSWKTQRRAKSDAAFEAVIALHKAGLINDHLVPLNSFVSEDVDSLSDIEKRPGLAEVDQLIRIWRVIAQRWQESPLQLYKCSIQSRTQGESRTYGDIFVDLVAPIQFPPMSELNLFIDENCTGQVFFSPRPDVLKSLNVDVAQQSTELILRAGLRSRVSANKHKFAIQCFPYESVEDLPLWLESANGSAVIDDILEKGRTQKTLQAGSVGVVRDLSNNSRPYLLMGTEEHEVDERDQDNLTQELHLRTYFRVRKFPKRRDLMHQLLSSGSVPKHNLLLQPDHCTVDQLPAAWALFSLRMPSICHYLSVHWIAEHLRSTIFADVFQQKDLHLVVTALSTSSAQEQTNYQRIEFLGDSLLKGYTSLLLMVAHPIWPEGYLSKAKDQIVSNGRLAGIAKRLRMGRYILIKRFTGAKWRPMYVDELLEEEEELTAPTRLISTKVLADVVEALIGAAWLAGGEESLLRCLRIFFPLMTWQESSKSLAELRTRARPVQCSENYIAEISELVGHHFRTPSLMIQAITPPGNHIEGSCPSYQRLEFLGDALLDMFVTVRIWSDDKELPERWMHRIRAATVSGGFLAFCALARQIQRTVEIPTTLQRVSATTDHLTKGSKVYYETEASYKSLFSFLRTCRSPAMKAEHARTQECFERLAPEIVFRLVQGGPFPWAELAAIAPPKVASDLVESTLAALVIDHGHLQLEPAGEISSPPHDFLKKFGIFPTLETILSSNSPQPPVLDPYMMWHPIEELAVLSGQETAVFKLRTDRADWEAHISPQPSNVTVTKEEVAEYKSSNFHAPADVAGLKHRCKVIVGSRCFAEVCGRNANEAKIRAADAANSVLRQEWDSRRASKNGKDVCETEDVAPIEEVGNGLTAPIGLDSSETELVPKTSEGNPLDIKELGCLEAHDEDTFYDAMQKHD